jgi:signal transduction histidine kinase
MTERLIFRALLSLVLSGPACLPAMGQDLIVARAVFTDLHGGLSRGQLPQAEFLPSGKTISQGYTPAVLWVRLQVLAPAGTRHLALRVFPAQLEEVVLFSDGLPEAGQALVGRSTWIAARPGRNVYDLRVRTSGPMLLHPRILSPEQARQDDALRSFLLGALLACYVPLLAWLLILVVTRRQALHGVFLVNLSVVVISFLGWMGYLPELLGAAHWLVGPAAIHFLGVVNVFTGFLCVYLVLSRFGLPSWGRPLFHLLGGLYATLFVLFFLQERQWVLQASTFLGLLASLLGLTLTFAVFQRHKPGTWLIGGIMVLALALGLRWFLTVYTLVPAVDSLANLLFFRLFFAMSFVFATLWLIDREKRCQLQISLMKETVARQLAESETLRREAQERFMTMLIHEIKTPLAIIQLAASSLGRHLAAESVDATRVRNINHSVDDLNALVERCVTADQIDQGALRMHKQSLCLTALVREVLQSVDAGRVRLLGTMEQTVFSDDQYVRLILLNLLSNALKYSPPQSSVELQWEPAVAGDKPGVTVLVRNAVGVAGTPDAAQVFARYYRAEGARKQVGAGLGLWLARSLAGQLGSELHYQADREQVIFSFFLESA